MFTFTHRNPEMQLDRHHTALVLADIQNDFLSEDGSYYPLIEHSLKANRVPDHIEELLRAAKQYDIPVIHSPHYYFPTDAQWVAPGGAISDYLATQISFVGRKDPVDLEGFVGSGADYPERYKPYLQDGKTANTSPHKGASARTNDVIKQLRMRRIEKVIMAGPVGNICLEGHMRDIIEEGMEVAMVRDAVAGGRNEEGDAYLAAMINYRYLANAVWTTEETVRRMKAVASNEQA
ncbi:isochorismatase family protein [Burkholderia cenocepacia]|uniref:isochorismatase family protein n=2 Tax=Burkholderia cenocepacia TaxID=95486 RepID=UPI0009E10BC9|nr:isochorismatase family protein [Burkholderia cenocepacia]ARF86778.1 isochorismatase [Burkholderia cenocepacia]MCW3674614.1 cysteine hydrolase [Burkholderia cenocepacia]SPV02552.1 isochorismatase hydrolase [Burkholderia cenocepacia]